MRSGMFRCSLSHNDWLTVADPLPFCHIVTFGQDAFNVFQFVYVWEPTWLGLEILLSLCVTFDFNSGFTWVTVCMSHYPLSFFIVCQVEQMLLASNNASNMFTLELVKSLVQWTETLKRTGDSKEHYRMSVLDDLRMRPETQHWGEKKVFKVVILKIFIQLMIVKTVSQNEVKQWWWSIWPVDESTYICDIVGYHGLGVCGDISSPNQQQRTVSDAFYISQQGLIWVEQTPKAVSDQCTSFSLPVSYNQREKENTASRRWQFNYKYRSKGKEGGNRLSTDTIWSSLLSFAMNFVKWGPKVRLQLQLITKDANRHHVTQIFEITTLKWKCWCQGW